MPTTPFRSRPDESPELGDIKINHNVVAGIARLAALEVEGVASVGSGLIDGISELFSKRESDARGVKITEAGDDAYAVELRLVVYFGAEIARTAYAVQTAVRQQITAMTGKEVQRVDVIVEGVRLHREETEPGRQNPDKNEEIWPDVPAMD